MHYYIDGYNFLFRTLHAGEDLKSQRQRLILDLNAQADLLNLSMTIVFDSMYQPGESTRSHYRYLEIIYTAEKESADDYIIKYLKSQSDPKNITVVTSDKKLGWRARIRGAKNETIEHFLASVNKRCKSRLTKLKEKKTETAEAVLIKVKATVLLSKSKKPKKNEKPRQEQSPEECQDYYLQQFQSRYEALHQEAAKKAPLKGGKRKKAPLPKEEEPLSEIERWLKIFEKNVKE